MQKNVFGKLVYIKTFLLVSSVLVSSVFITLSRHEQVCLMKLGFKKILLPSLCNVNNYVAHI